MHLGRRPPEPVDGTLEEFYQWLLACLRRPEVRTGEWRLLETRPAWEGNPTWGHFITFAWEGPNGALLVVAVNFGPTRGQCYVSLPFEGLTGGRFLLRDLLGPFRYEREGDELAGRGLYLDLPEWGYHVFDFKPME